ncbi:MULTISPECIES: LPS export ABC transporter permease LptG [unclassified Psychrobacter]|uniref:LPS export ABC transporter permease LptG n=1 Tax=unclassified Psychrobacter TaxID=196806 RepID=UPI00071E905F|nr:MULTISPECIES: LPS export ABC transporter permease LptG [unclassified Psychrobacter]OLF37442.1 LPS export ABC transporter permease LptG [Psychrobacter sp. Cmf 22.2]
MRSLLSKLSKAQIPQSRSSNLKVLGRYVKTNALLAIIAAVVGLWALQVLFTYLSELEDLSDSYTMSDALRYIFYRSPYFLEQFMPTGALLGAVVGLGLLASKSELVVMRAAGVSIYRIVGWVLQPALLFVLLALILNQFVLPNSNQLAREINNEDSSSLVTSVRGYWTMQPRFQSSTEGNMDGSAQPDGSDILYIDYADVQGNIGEVKRWHLDNNGDLQTATHAMGGQYIGRESLGTTGKLSEQYRYEWQLNNMTELTINRGFESSQSKTPLNTLSLPFAPESVYLLTRDAEDLSLTQLYEHRQFMQQQGKRSLPHELAFWQKLLSPLSILSLVIVACSFVFGSLRTHSLGLRIVVALLFGLLFSYVQDLVGFVSLATGFSPMLMVLLPIIGSAALGFYLIKRQM